MSTSAALPRPEHPRPQFVRPDWLSLNGEWQFEIDRSDSGLERGVCGPGPADQRDHRAVRAGVRAVRDRQHRLPRGRLVPRGPSGSRPTGTATTCCCTSGAVDHDATVWVNGVEVVRHRGGFTPFSADLHGVGRRRATRPSIVVRARDTRHGVAGPRQAGHAVRQPRLPLHPHHRHLADGLAGGRARGPPAAGRGSPRTSPVRPSTVDRAGRRRTGRAGQVRAVLVRRRRRGGRRRGPRRPRPRAAADAAGARRPRPARGRRPIRTCTTYGSS